MKLIFSVFNKFKLFAILFASIGIVVVVAGNIYYQVIKTDQFLWNELSILMHSPVKNKQKLPLGWHISTGSKIGVESVYVGFAQDSYFTRNISTDILFQGELKTVHKDQHLLWSKYDVLFVIAVAFVIVSIIILLFYVLKMFLISYIWKNLVSVEHACNKEDVDSGEALFTGFSRLNVIVEFAIHNTYLKKLFADEYSSIIKRLSSDIDYALEQKKVPEQNVPELLAFKQLIVI